MVYTMKIHMDLSTGPLTALGYSLDGGRCEKVVEDIEKGLLVKISTETP
jgi:hypothetical protein